MEIYPEFFASRHGDRERLRRHARPSPIGAAVFVIDVPEELPYVESDLSKFRQVALNLLSNAVKFSPPESSVTVTARRCRATRKTADASRCATKASASPRRITRRFSRSSGRSTPPRGVSSAAPVSVSRSCGRSSSCSMEAYRVESAPRRRIDVFIHASASARRSTAAAPQPVASTGSRILVVEDDPSACELISAALGSAGYRADPRALRAKRR